MFYPYRYYNGGNVIFIFDNIIIIRPYIQIV